MAVKDVSVKYTDDSELFMTERWARSHFAYFLPLQEEGDYVLITQHAEVS